MERLCDNCNSVIHTVKDGKSISLECSYCGKPYNNFEVEDFYSEDEYGDNE